MRKRDSILAVIIVALLLGLIGWTAFAVSTSKPTPQQTPQSTHQAQYTPIPDGWMISDITISASNVTGGYDTHPNIYGHLIILDSQGRTIVDSDWSRLNDWFGSYNQNFGNFTRPNPTIAGLLDPSRTGNTTALLASIGKIEVTVQSGMFHNTETVTLPAEPQCPWCQDYTSPFSTIPEPPTPTSTLTLRMPNFTVQIVLTAVGHCKVS